MAVAVLAARQWDALVALFPIESNLAATLAGSFTVPVHGVTASPADGNITQIALPTWETFDVAVIVANKV